MNKDQTLSHTTGRVSFKELQQIIKMGLVQGNLIPAFAGAWLAIVMTNHSFLSSIPQILLMLVGSTLIMGACALNNYYDQDIEYCCWKFSWSCTTIGWVAIDGSLSLAAVALF